jgi:hypothetical protein
LAVAQSKHLLHIPDRSRKNAQFEEAFLAFPELDASRGKPLAHHTVL